MQPSRNFKPFDTTCIQPLETRIEFAAQPCSYYYLRAGLALASGDLGGFATWTAIADAVGC